MVFGHAGSLIQPSDRYRLARHRHVDEDREKMSDVSCGMVTRPLCCLAFYSLLMEGWKVSPSVLVRKRPFLTKAANGL